MPKIETNRRRIVQRLESEGWVSRGGARHEIFENAKTKAHLAAPRHRELTSGVARDVARAAGWI